MSSRRDLFVRQLAYRTSSETLREVFGKYGELDDVKIPTDPSGRSRGFGFVTFRSDDDARQAREALDGFELDGFRISVNFSEKSRGGHAPFPPTGAGRRRRSPSPPRRDGYGRGPDQGFRRGGNDMRRSGGGGFSRPSEDPLDSKIYISGLPPDTTVEELADHFSMTGKIARKRPHNKKGFPDQWPFNIKLYFDDNDVFRGDALVAYEDPNAALTAPGFYDGGELRGHTITVQVARKM